MFKKFKIKNSIKIKNLKLKIVPFLLFAYLLIFAFLAQKASAGPSSSSFELKEYGFGAGGTENSTSSNFKMFGTVGEVDMGSPSSALYRIGSGLVFTQTAFTPPAPTFTNPASNYDRLKIVINQGGNPSDTTYAAMISTDNFVNDIRYVKSDFTIGTALVIGDFQNYTTWNGASGKFITGLISNTTYYVRVKARQGNFSESFWGPVASVATADPSLSFGLDTSSINFTNLNSGNSYTDSSKQTTMTTSTNAYNGYIVYATENQTLTGPTTITDYASPNNTPTAWSGTGFGYSTSDSNLPTGGTSDRFTTGGPKYAGFTPGTQDPVADHTSVIQDPTLINESFNILYRVTAPSTIEGGTYTNTIIYTIVPIY